MTLIIEKTKQDWDIKINNQVKHCPFIVVDNWYTQEELKNIWTELDFYSSADISNIDKAEDSENVARDQKTNESKSNAYRFYLWDTYTNEGAKISHIMNCLYKQRSEQFKNIVLEAMPLHHNNFLGTNTDGTMVSYYEKEQYYKPHSDSVQFTCLIWLYKEPKKFFGGNLKLTPINKTIECIPNRMLFFPSYLQHEVSEVKSKKDIEFGYGRYCITHFYNWISRSD